MKKFLSFFRSMGFGMALLILILAFSLAGSLIPQGAQRSVYVNNYSGNGADIILALGLDHVFSTPYFIALMAVLSLNLALCSLVRLARIRNAGRALLAKASVAEIQKTYGADCAKKLRPYLKSRHFHERDSDGQVYSKHLWGFYGSYLTHLSLLLVLISGAAVAYLADVQDYTVMPGNTLTLEDGTNLEVISFRIEDEAGNLDYTSVLQMTSRDGSSVREGSIRVNEPMRFGDYKVYQQTYGTAGSVRITNALNGISEELTITEQCFLTLDGVNGMFYRALYPGYISDADGNVTLITSTSGEYADPVYDILSFSDGVSTPILAFPGETLTIGDVSFTMLDPVSYPGLRVKHLPGAVSVALYAAFVLMLFALYLCFFMPPICVRVTDEGYAILSPKDQMDLSRDIDEYLESTV
ncbi:MAG: cytochrome c biogenesis protein ResB [Clostridia bacterium]|nr:cytochrome c biogenesis protein ResB [Clostridia bacterium]